MVEKKILVTRSSMPGMNEYFDEISSLWDSHWLTNMGVKHQELEANLKDYLNTPNVTLFTNGHNALECAFEAMGLTEGEVITTPFTFASTTHAIVRKGMTPVMCDIKLDDCTMDPAKIEELITENTVAIVPVHVYGNLCDVEAIKKIADKHNLKVIYDAAHAFGVTRDGVSSANFGDVAMYSFHATKVFNTIEGGALCYQDSSLSRELDAWKNFGNYGPEDNAYVGGNSKMNEFCAAMGICNLRHVDDEIAKRKSVSVRYHEHLKGVKGLRILEDPKAGDKHNYAYFPVLFDDSYGATRDEVFEELAKNNVIARKYFYPAINAFKCYQDIMNEDDTPVAKFISHHVLTLPMYADLSLEDVDRICEIILTLKK